MDDAEQRIRLNLLQDAVRILTESPGISAYIDVGHPRWLDPEEAASRLQRAGIEQASGFSINVSSHASTEESTSYGYAIAQRVRRSYIVDVGRSGAGYPPDGEWCNAPLARLGPSPTTQVQTEGCDAWLWIKPPGESDGQCNGGPAAGTWSADLAARLLAR